MSDILIFLAILGTLLIGHELGHFLAARIAGVAVEEFGLGIPPRLLTLFEWHGTKYTLNLLPFGGFVRLAGTDDPSVPNGLAAASRPKRAFVLISGAAVNVFLAFAAFTAAYRFAAPDLDHVLAASVSPNSPAEAAGMLPGDLITTFAGEPIGDLESLQNAIASHLGQEVQISLLRDGEPITVSIVPRPEPPPDEGPIGIIIGYPTKQVGWIESLKMGWESTTFQFSETLKLPGRLLRGELAPEEARLSGLKGIYDMVSWAGSIDRSSQRPFMTLNLVGIISAGWALANLLPIPALDGGRLFFLLIETILRRRIPPRHEALAHAIGFALLLVLMVYINLQDFLNPISLPH
jgi:regulator of sigma E protease